MCVGRGQSTPSSDTASRDHLRHQSDTAAMGTPSPPLPRVNGLPVVLQHQRWEFAAAAAAVGEHGLPCSRETRRDPVWAAVTVMVASADGQ